MSKEDVILHLPFPVIKSFLPSDCIFSIIVTSFPFSADDIADIIPAGPPPITITFIFSPNFYFCISSIAFNIPYLP
jgi:hypothetical protein